MQKLKFVVSIIGIGLLTAIPILPVTAEDVGLIKEVKNLTSVIQVKNGNVGIGTTSPGAKLDVVGPVRFYVTAPPKLDSHTYIWGESGFGANYGSYNHRWHVGNPGREAVRLEASGNLGIGATNPQATLHVENATSEQVIISSTASNPGLTLRANGIRAWSFGVDRNDSGKFVINDRNANNKTRLAIDHTGNVHIGTSGAGATLRVNGQVVCTGGCTGSSRELKDNIVDLNTEEALDTLSQLRPTKFTYKHNQAKAVGFIAEDVPDLVAKKGRKGLDAMDIVAVLTKVVQEQQAENKTLKTRLARLEALVSNGQ